MTPLDTLELGPLGTYVIMKWVEKVRRLTYDPSQHVGTEQMGP